MQMLTHSITAIPGTDWSRPYARTADATSEGREYRYTTARSSSEEASTFERVQRRILGRAIAFAGSVNILLGTMLADQHLAARGHRQRVVGMLQLNCEVDRRTADAFVDRWLSKRVMHEA
jgi:uncharacterized protein YjbJ (UPF0337 family)